MNEKRNEILINPNNFTATELAESLQKKIVSTEDLQLSGLSQEKLIELRKTMLELERSVWENALQCDSCEALTDYLTKFPQGAHAIECAKLLEQKDKAMWEETKKAITEDKITKYLKFFPTGAHAIEGKAILNDAEWLLTLQKNTIEAFEQYRSNHPERHIQEISAEINRLSDDRDWNSAQEKFTIDAIQHYVLNHPNGHHITEAKTWINDFSLKSETLETLAKNPNSCSAKQLQEYVKKKIISLDELRKIFDKHKIDAILNYETPVSLPVSYPPKELDKGRAEVYFWGTPSSGKTSAISATLCCANKNGILTFRESQGIDYMSQLASLFKENEVCVFPTNTQSNCIYEMQLSLRDEKNKEHELTLIDLAGEVFRAMYEKQAGLIVSDEATVNTTMNYVLDQKNEKIHFFVVEYGKHYSNWHGVRMDNYLDACANFLAKNKILRKSTNAVYILVTKTDQIQCAPEDRPRLAYEYIKEYYPSFYNGLELACQQAGIGDFRVISFSMGDVFAQQLCLFDDLCAWKIINKLLLKTSATKKGWWKILTQ